jgi:hypothetical protein
LECMVFALGSFLGLVMVQFSLLAGLLYRQSGRVTLGDEDITHCSTTRPANLAFLALSKRWRRHGKSCFPNVDPDSDEAEPLALLVLLYPQYQCPISLFELNEL